MNTRQRLSFAVGFVILSALVSVLAAPSLPEELITHWNAAGEPDGTMSKGAAIALAPAFSVGLLLLLVLIPRIDPLGENVEEFRGYYDWFAVIFTGFMFVLHAGIIAFNLGYTFDFTLLIVGLLAVLFYYVGVLLTHAERNWFVGIRTPWTLSNTEVWNRTHELGGKLFKLTALIALLGLFFGDYALYFLLVPTAFTAVSTVLYSYYLYSKMEDPSEEQSDSPHRKLH